MDHNPSRPGAFAREHAFTLAELLVVLGILALLVSLLLPPLRAARAQALQTQCLAREQQIGLALTMIRDEFGFNPLWDDGGSPVRYTWLDVLVQRGYLRDSRAGYCPADRRPDPLNEARARAVDHRLVYPLNPTRAGVDYSYGISVPLSAGGWALPKGTVTADGRPRRFENHEQWPARRVLVADGTWAAIFNLGGRGYTTQVWNDPTQFENTVAWRHPGNASNMLFQDGHVRRVRLDPSRERPIDTVRQFIWYPDEPDVLGPNHRWGDNWYPLTPPPSAFSDPPGNVLPSEVIPRYYTSMKLWTRIDHK